uniref:Uncharacterized protein n=1 Tax=Physcomitrium patens TaxID=3218 RepID=A0A2K1KE83_PHYPA|nr:hypothetical protein PHYPA_008467 [Physcomitrium patens]
MLQTWDRYVCAARTVTDISLACSRHSGFGVWLISAVQPISSSTCDFGVLPTRGGSWRWLPTTATSRCPFLHIKLP